MTIEQLTSLLGWSTLIHFVFLVFWFAMLTVASEYIYRLHQRWFPISREHFFLAHYSLMGFYKLCVLLFFAVPFLLLLALF